MYSLIRNLVKSYKISIVFFFFSLFLTYNYTDFSSNMSVGVGHVYTAKSLTLSQNFNVDEYWGNAGVDVFKFNESYYVAYAPLNAILMAIPYFFLQVVYYLYTNSVGDINGDFSVLLESLFFSLPSTLSIFLLSIFIKKYLLHIGIKKRIADISIISFLFSTIMLNYSVSFFNHAHTALFIFLAFYFLETSGRTYKSYFLAGLFTGLSFLNEFPSVLFSIAVLFREIFILISLKYSVISKETLLSIRRLITYALPVFCCILLILFFNQIHFGSFYTFSESILRYYKYERLGIVSNIGTFTQNPFYGLFGLYLSPLKGLFFYSPFLIFFILGLKTFYKNNKNAFVLSTSYVVIISILYSLWVDCFGASPLGARYLISVIPFYIIFCAVFLNTAAKNSHILYLVLSLFSFIVLFINLLDRLPNQRFLKCYIYSPAIYHKSFKYISDFVNGNPRFAPVILDYFFDR